YPSVKSAHLWLNYTIKSPFRIGWRHMSVSHSTRSICETGNFLPVNQVRRALQLPDPAGGAAQGHFELGDVAGRLETGRRERNPIGRGRLLHCAIKALDGSDWN